MHRIGSLAVDYQIFGTDKLANVTLDDVIKESFEKDPNIQLSTNNNEFSGTINPESQQLRGKNLSVPMNLFDFNLSINFFSDYFF